MTDASCITNNGKGKAGRFTPIPLPIGEVEGTSSYNTKDAGNLACIPEDAPADKPVVVTDQKTGKKTEVKQIKVKVTQRDFENQPIQPAQLKLDRAPHSLKNYNTNIYANSTTQTFTDTIMGRQVEIKAIPISYTFNYGDGATLTTSNPGASVGDRWDIETPTSHVYSKTGDFNYSVTTVYRGEWRVPGGPWQVIAGTAQRSSPAQTVQVWKIKAHNVDQNCIQNPGGPGCPTEK